MTWTTYFANNVYKQQPKLICRERRWFNYFNLPQKSTFYYFGNNWYGSK